MKILISNITPRGDDHLLDISRQEFNLKLLKEFNNSQCVYICDNSNLSSRGIVNGKFYGQDKLHLNQVGTKILAGNITSKLRVIHGIPQKQMFKNRYKQKSKKIIQRKVTL